MLRLRVVLLVALVACGSTHADATDAGASDGGPAGSACHADAECATSACSSGLCACPDGMSTVPRASGPATCIDRIEVTNRAYSDFVAACPDGCPSLLPFRCNSDTNVAPRTAETTDPGTESSINCFRESLPARIGAGFEDYPVVCVDWCSAFAYCAWRGKRLCNGSEWVDACSDRGAKTYAYAQSFDACACNVAD
ncbi:MAG TPA: SUMF1/EgtB/PvdO family nonheme iron enzyme, partial [Labilithrix sp.]